MKIDLERHLGPLSVRAWGLVVNFFGNAVGLYGLTRYLNSEGGLVLMTVGAAITIACLLILAQPNPGREDA